MYKDSAIIDIRKYLLHEIALSEILDRVEYPDVFNKEIPIIPIHQMPEVNDNIGDPFIVYELEVNSIGVQFWQLSETVTFYIYGVEYEKILSLQSLIVDIFRRYEMSAQDINVFCHSENTFVFTSVDDSNVPNAPTSEAGRLESSVSITYVYQKSINNRGRFAF